MKRFKKYLEESVVATKRQPLEHLENMKPLAFLSLLKKIHEYGGKLHQGNTTIHEKIDGIPIRFGWDENGRFFLENSKSNPVYSGQAFVDFFASINKAHKGYAYAEIFDHFDKSKGMVNFILSKHPKGVKFIAELLATGLAKYADDHHLTSMLVTYDRAKLGDMATFVLYDAVDPTTGERLEDYQELIRDFSSQFDSPEVKLTTSKLHFAEIDLGTVSVGSVVANYDEYTTVLQSRKAADKDAKVSLERLLDSMKDNLKNEITAQFKDGHLFGLETEGHVVKVGDHEFKITSDLHKERMRSKNPGFKL